MSDIAPKYIKRSYGGPIKELRALIAVMFMHLASFVSFEATYDMARDLAELVPEETDR